MSVCTCDESKVDVLCETHGDPMTISQAEYERLVRIENAAKMFVRRAMRSPVMLQNPEWFDKEFGLLRKATDASV